MKIKISLLLIISILLLCACGSSSEVKYDELPFMTVGDISISIPAAKLYFYAFEKREEAAGAKTGGTPWDRVIYSDGNITYADYVKEVLFYENLINGLALAAMFDEGNELSSQEITDIQNKAAEFYEHIEENDKKMLGLSEKDVEELFILDIKSSKKEKEYLNGKEIALSEEEYRVCLVRKFLFESIDAAEYFTGSISEEKSEPDYSLATDSLIINIDKQTDIPSEQIKDIFGLKNGELSQIYEEGDDYIVYLMLNVFDKDLSILRKNELIDEQKKSAWQTACAEYIETAATFYNEQQWKALKFSSGDGFSAGLADLFDYLE